MTDLRYALRSLARSPGYVATAALTLAVGIAGNTIVMAIAEGLALRPIPAAQPDTLVRIYPVSDAITYAIASLVVLASSLAACYLPARRAGRLEPMTVLRIE